MTAFTAFVNERHGTAFSNYRELYKWSVTKIEDFWTAVWDFCGIVSSKPYATILEKKPMDEIPRWFIGARLNYAENLLRFRDDRIALIETGESGHVHNMTYAQLYEQVSQLANAFRAYGIKPGDRIAGYITNSSHTVVAMLAATAVGAIWSSASPDFGTTGVLERFSQIAPRILFSINAVVYNGKVHDHLDKLKLVAQGLPSVEKVVVFRFVDQDFDVTDIPKAEHFSQFVQGFPAGNIEFEQLPFDHPVFILYSSGTTGKPKCIVHSAGGSLIQHLKEHVIHGNMKRDDVFFYYTTTGWMMWNWLVSGLSVGCTLVLYDGSPFKPSPRVLWELAEKFKFTIFGTSAKYIQALQAAGIKPMADFDLSALRILYSTGSPLQPENFDYVYACIKKDVLLGSITGGTDIVSLFAGHNTNLPVHRGEIQCRCLGMAIEAWVDEGKHVDNEPGDLVCVKPFPCMPVYFWKDPGNEKYFDAYFNRFKGVWYHGDFVQINSGTQGVTMLGRSDGTLNPGGVRFGSAELYTVMNFFEDVEDSLVVGQKMGDDERVIMFCKMKAGKDFTPELESAIRNKIRAQLSPRHIPSIILPIADIPYTLTGKKVEIAVKKILAGDKVTSTALANPESLQLYYDLPNLKLKL